MKWEQIGDQPCSIARTLAEVGDRWTLLVLRQAFAGQRRFADIAEGTGAQRNLVSDRLKRLVAAGILERTRYQDHPPREEYRLTDKGHDLYPVLLALARWGDRWLAGSEGVPVAYVHKTCGSTMHGELVCSCCGEAVESRNVQALPGPGFAAGVERMRDREDRE